MNLTTRAIGLAAALGLGLTGSAAFAQLVPPSGTDQPEQAPAVQPVPAGNGRIVFFSDTADAGAIFDTAPVELEFRFRNVGGGPLTITNVKSTCGCTVPDLEKTTYEVDEVGVITARFDPKGMQGNAARTIQVFTDSTSTPVQNITVKAFVKPVVITNPHDLLSFEAVEKGQGAVKEVRVFGRFPEFEVSRASTTDPLLYDVEVISVGEAESMGDTVYERLVRVTLKKSAPPGQHTGSLTIRTNDERKSIFSLPLISRVIGDLEMSPVRMTLGRLNVGDTFEREIRVRSRSAQPFEISQVTLANQSVSAEFEFEPVDPEVRNEWIVRAKGVVRSAAPRFNATVNLLTDVEGEELTPFYLTGVLRPR